MTVLQFHQAKKGKGATTTNALVTALALRELRSVKVLIVSGEDAAHYLGARYDPEVKFIYNYISTNTLSAEKLQRYSTALYDRMYFLWYRPEDDAHGNALEAVLRAAEGAFDYVILDVKETELDVKGNIYIDTLNQCDRSLETYFDAHRERMKRVTEKRLQFIGQYQNALGHYRLRQMRRLYRNSIYAVPFDCGLHRAASDSVLISYMKAILGEEKTRYTGELRRHVEDLLGGLLRLEEEASQAS